MAVFANKTTFRFKEKGKRLNHRRRNFQVRKEFGKRFEVVSIHIFEVNVLKERKRMFVPNIEVLQKKVEERIFTLQLKIFAFENL
jgi:hypothetical protein